MAKNFGASAGARIFESAARVSAEKAQVVTVRMIRNEDLLDYEHNGEDISYTDDLEASIAELGFTDPIEVTSYGAEYGKHIIVSGHRRRCAGVKCGIELFPCIVRSFDNDNEMKNYVLLANSHRDSAKDPLLFCRRYKLHEEFLKGVGFEGSLRQEIARRLGVSVPQADRYNQMNKIITPFWDWVRDDTAGLSSVLPLAALDENEQREAYEYLKNLRAEGVTLTRERVKHVIDGRMYRHKESGGDGAEATEFIRAEESVADETEESETVESEIDKPAKIIQPPSAYEDEKPKPRKAETKNPPARDASAENRGTGGGEFDEQINLDGGDDNYGAQPPLIS
jgi:hypothetical protein